MRATHLVLVASIALAAACVLPARLFSATLEAGPATKALQVTLEDQTGLVQAFGPAQPGQFNLVEGVGAPDKPDVLVVSWTGGACDLQTHLVFSGMDGTYLITATTERDAGICTLQGFLRTVSIGLANPIDPTLVRLDTNGGT